MYDQLIYALKSDYEDVWEYIEDNVNKYSQQQWNLLFNTLLLITYEFMIESEDVFTWNLIYEDIIIFLKKNKKFNNQLIDSILFQLKHQPMNFQHDIYESVYYPATLFESLCLGINCNCTRSKIIHIYNQFIESINEE